MTLNLTLHQVDSALPRVSVGLGNYIWFQHEFRIRDVASDVEFQKRFGGFYQVRRSSTWRAAFFQILERAKSSPVSFGKALTAVHEATGRVEASFASKLVATLDPGQPVIDSVVLKNLGLKLPPVATADRFTQIQALHQRLADLYSEYLASESGRELVRRFRRV
jgi:hypothetical protein